MPRLGRLFWKFFAFFWVAQLVTALVVGLLIWWLHVEHRHEPPPAGIPAAAMHPPDRPGAHEPRPQRGPLPPFEPILAGTLVSFVFAALLAWYFSRPIRSLRSALDDAATGRLATRVGPALANRHDELADLGLAFDRMAEQLEAQIEGQRRLLHDVSHELRSPLARLQATSALIAQRPERAIELLPRIELECGRIDRLVDELLTLARLDSGITEQLDETNDLVALLGEVADDAELEGAAKQLDILLDCSVSNAPLRCNRALLLRALGNVTRNAVKFAPEQSAIEIRLMPLTNSVGWQVDVSDRGPGVTPTELTQIFEPFVRGDRTRDNDGYGLGLAITRRILLAHGGSVSAQNRAEGGLCVSFNLTQ
jgi:signal transduction histidine kinase